MNDSSSLDRLNARLEELERRVAKLERGQSAPEIEPASEPTTSTPLLPVLATAQGSGFFQVMGKAMLGIAGAYSLRAVAESRLIPQALLAPLAIVYALAWMAAAARSSRPMARSTYASASVLILAPMLWELTMRFHVLPAWADALSLAALAGLAFALVRTEERVAVLRIAFLAAAALALALDVATHSNLPFLAVLLLLVALGEYAANSGRAATVRGLVALAADLGVWMLIYLYRGPQSAHADYPVLRPTALIAPGFALFAIEGASDAFKACVQRQRITAFETVQTVVAFLLAACGLLSFGPSGRYAMLGAVCLVLAAAVYAALFTLLRVDVDKYNRTVAATWSGALLLAGSFLCFPAQWRSEWLGLIAIAAATVGARSNLFFLAVQGNAFLLAAAITSGLGAYAWQVFVATPAGAPSFAICFVLVCAIACYGVAQQRQEVTQPVSYVYVAIAALAIAALLAQAFISLAALGFMPEAQHLAILRSLALCAVALALAFCGSVRSRRELTHIAYAAVALEGVKLIAEDLRHGHLAYVAGSVCLFAITLIALPRVGRRAAA